MVYSDILESSDPDALVMAEYQCSSATATDIIGECRGAYLYGSWGSPIYGYLDPCNHGTVTCALCCDSRFDHVNRSKLAWLMLDAWEMGQLSA